MQNRRISHLDCSTWPWWLWLEHGVVLGFTGWRAAELWRAHRRRRQHELQLQDKAASCSAASSGASGEARRKPASGAPDTPDVSLESLPQTALATFQSLKALAGPPEVLSWPEVHEAPAPSMDMASVKDGEAVAFRDGRGAIYKFKLAEGVCVNMYHTRAGYRRSGDLHDCNQYDVVLAGRTRLRMIDPRSGREVVAEYGPNDFIVIPARTPHMFEFLEDNFLLEWWDGPFAAWYYRPYRDIIERNLPLAETQGRDLSRPLRA